ncbi:hypothetical protein BJY52DRAFT_1219046, partial [Lactarius psammicola]
MRVVPRGRCRQEVKRSEMTYAAQELECEVGSAIGCGNVELEGLVAPVTQGGRIATQAQQLTNFFIHYAGSDEPPLAEFYDSVLRVGQNHIEKVVRLKAAATYQISVADTQGLADMVLDDMSRQLYTHMTSDESARRAANQRSLDRLFVEAQHQLGPFISEWKDLYKHSLVQALKDNEEDREVTPEPADPLLKENVGYIKLFAHNRARELRESIAREVTDPILDGDEISRARERIRLDHADEIEEARRETRAAISSEKKAWAVAFRDSNKLDFLRKAAAELGFILIPKDDAEEREGRKAKRPATQEGKRSRSGSRAEDFSTPDAPTTPTNPPRNIDTSTTPKARKTKSKGKRSLVIPKAIRSRSVSLSSALSEVDEEMSDPIPPPKFFSSSYPQTELALAKTVERISAISIPELVRPSQAPEAPLRDPRRFPSEPATDISVFVDPRDRDTFHPQNEPIAEILSRVATPDSTRGVASSMHNPSNEMVDDPVDGTSAPAANTTPETGPVGGPPPPPPPIPSIPLMPGLAEMLTALQNNLVTSFTSQITGLSKRIDDQDSIIKSITTK